MAETDKTASTDAFSAALDGILSDPEMMSMISSMAEKLKGGSSPPEETPSSASQQPSSGEASEASLTAALPDLGNLGGAISALAPLLSGGLLASTAQDDKRACLLRALKPYLSKNRCDAIDQIIMLSRLSGLLKNRT